MREGDLSLGPTTATSRLVLLHGWGADADDLLDLGTMLAGEAIQVVALRAPEPHPGGFGRQWYDLQSPDWPGLPRALADLNHRLTVLAEQVPLERTVLLGFSQGAAMALDAAGNLPLAGLIACSGYPHPNWQPRTPRTEVLLTHGEQDPVVPYAASEEILRRWQAAGGRGELLGFAGGHTIDAAVLPPLQRFVQQRLDRAPFKGPERERGA
jgi:phospholipase/carboxylesterase